MRALFISMLLMASMTVNANIREGGNVGNGGDPIALEFLRSATQIISDIEHGKEAGKTDLFPEVNPLILKNITKNLKVVITEEKISVVVDGRIQESTAVNYPEKNLLLINRSLWSKITDQEQKMSLVLHELLGLAGLETSGDYSISKRYKVPDKGYNELIITRNPIFIIPSNAVSCYSAKTHLPGEIPTKDISNQYFKIPAMQIFRSESPDDLVVSMIRITYALPNAKGLPEVGQCQFDGDEIRALSSYWWNARFSEALIPGSKDGGDIFSTDCPVYCGGLSLKVYTETTADVEIMGILRNPKTQVERPVKMTRKINLISL